MTVPLMILAVLSLVGGFLGLPAGLGLPNWLEGWLEPVFEPMMAATQAEVHHLAIGTEIFLLLLSSVVALVGIGLAYYVYRRSPAIAENAARSLAPLYNLFVHKYYVDEIYNTVFVQPLRLFGQFLAKVVDVGLIDTILVDGSAKFVGVLGKITSGWQTGYLRNYVTSILIGGVLLSLYFFLR
jgi:NADH-quinone oxidoreductase subunit L